MKITKQRKYQIEQRITRYLLSNEFRKAALEYLENNSLVKDDNDGRLANPSARILEFNERIQASFLRDVELGHKNTSLEKTNLKRTDR